MWSKLVPDQVIGSRSRRTLEKLHFSGQILLKYKFV